MSAKAVAAAMLDLLDGLLFLTDFLLGCCFFVLAVVFFSASCCFLLVAFGVVVPGVDTEKRDQLNYQALEMNICIKDGINSEDNIVVNICQNEHLKSCPSNWFGIMQGNLNKSYVKTK